MTQVKELIFAPLAVGDKLTERTAELLFKVLLQGKLRPGDRVNESELARQLQVSRAPIREALRKLEEQGLLVNVPKRGMFVVGLEEEDIQKINRVRIVLESEALRLARERLTPKVEEKLLDLCEKIERMNPAAPAWPDADFEFHRTIWRLAGNEYIEKALTTVTARLFAQDFLFLMREKLIWDPNLAHRPLIDFLRGRSERSAEELMVEHLMSRRPTGISPSPDGKIKPK